MPADDRALCAFGPHCPVMTIFTAVPTRSGSPVNHMIQTVCMAIHTVQACPDMNITAPVIQRVCSHLGMAKQAILIRPARFSIILAPHMLFLKCNRGKSYPGNITN